MLKINDEYQWYEAHDYQGPFDRVQHPL
jgi:hypothetical protein